MRGPKHVVRRGKTPVLTATPMKFLELAVDGRADLIVSGDGELLALNPFRDIPMVTPAIFVQGAAR